MLDTAESFCCISHEFARLTGKFVCSYPTLGRFSLCLDCGRLEIKRKCLDFYRVSCQIEEKSRGRRSVDFNKCAYR